MVTAITWTAFCQMSHLLADEASGEPVRLFTLLLRPEKKSF
jgi:hypothetical protein